MSDYLAVTLTPIEVAAINRLMLRFIHQEAEVENLFWRKARPEEQSGGYPRRIVDQDMVQATQSAFGKIDRANSQGGFKWDL